MIGFIDHKALGKIEFETLKLLKMTGNGRFMWMAPQTPRVSEEGDY
jgi:hypothetical protein